MCPLDGYVYLKFLDVYLRKKCYLIGNRSGLILIRFKYWLRSTVSELKINLFYTPTFIKGLHSCIPFEILTGVIGNFAEHPMRTFFQDTKTHRLLRKRLLKGLILLKTGLQPIDVHREPRRGSAP